MAAIEGREGEEWDGEQDEALETEQLALQDEDDRLPWLEGADDDDYAEESAGSGLGKLILMGLAALVVLVGAIWWATHRNPDPGAEPDGSLVKAESPSYKEAPKDPGGKTFEGTGDSSFAVSEGQNRPAQLEQKGAPAPAPAPAASAEAKPAAAGGVGVQVGAFSSKDAAEAGWTRIVSQANGALSGVSHRVIAGSADNGTIYRLQAVAGDAGAAAALCGKLKAAGVACQVK
ncbi:MAG: SPOR domain-containing protein [Novosphingobium sp.]